MRQVLLPFFVFRLGLALLPFFVQLGWLVISPFIGLFMLFSLVFLYTLLFARHFTNLVFWQQTPSLPAATALSPTTQELQQKIVKEYAHTLWYRDDKSLVEQQQQLRELLKKSPTHRDLLINEALLKEILPPSDDDTTGSTSALQKVSYIDPNFPLVTLTRP